MIARRDLQNQESISKEVLIFMSYRGEERERAVGIIKARTPDQHFTHLGLEPWDS